MNHLPSPTSLPEASREPDDSRERCREPLYQQLKQPRMLLMGMPDRAKHFFEMNVAQSPQGPMLRKDLFFIPSKIRERIDASLKYAWNPKREGPYAGLHLIEQNLRRDFPELDVTLVDHPKRQAILKLIDERYFPLIGISIGCENQILEAEALTDEIRNRYMAWAGRMKFALTGAGPAGPDDEDRALEELKKKFDSSLAEKLSAEPELLYDLMPTLVFGNYGATAAKILFGNETRLNQASAYKTHILWDAREERVEKRSKGVEPYIGEGVHDMRVFLKSMGFPIRAEPNDTLVSEPVSEPRLQPENALVRHLLKKLGLFAVITPMNSIATAVGCTNRCDFCNTAMQFEGKKYPLLKSIDELFQSMELKAQKDRLDPLNPPHSYFWILDENFTKTPQALEKLSELVSQSKEHIRWGTNTDIAGLIEYKRKHGNFRNLVHGGANVLWLGIESKADIFRKRAGATPEEVKALVQELQSLGIGVIGSFMLGLPHHTEGPTVVRPNGSIQSLNIWEDLKWDISLNTTSNQVTVYDFFAINQGKNAAELERERVQGRRSPLDMLSLPDDRMVHISTTRNPTDIPDDRLEAMDLQARRMFYQENGPMVLRGFMTWWDGFKSFRDSKDPLDLKAATGYYWQARSNLHLASFGIPLFSKTFFEPCSDDFLNRFAQCLSEVEQAPPPEGELSQQYKTVYDRYLRQISPVAKRASDAIRKRFIAKHLRHQHP